MSNTREITKNNKYRVFPEEYNVLSKKIHTYKNLKNHISSSIFFGIWGN